jgi:AcrR family transcriptional regulator
MTVQSKTRKRAARRNPDQARAVIVRAAAQVFTEKGFHRATVEDIAHASGYAPASVYKYFHGKEELLFGIWCLVSGEMNQLLDEIEAMPTPFGVRLRWFSVKLTRLLEDESDLMFSFMSMYPTPSRVGMTQAEIDALEQHELLLRRLTALMQQGIKENSLETGDPHDYAVAFLSLLRGCAFHSHAAPSSTPLSARLAMTVEMFLRGSARVQD